MYATITNPSLNKTRLTPVSIRKVIIYNDGSREVQEIIGKKKVGRSWFFGGSDKKAQHQLSKYV